MKKQLTLVVTLAFTLIGVANAHGPSRQKLTETIEINATPDKIWSIVKEFGHPEA